MDTVIAKVAAVGVVLLQTTYAIPFIIVAVLIYMGPM